MTEAVAQSGWSVFQYPDFRRFFAARFMTGLAQQIHNVGLGWLVYERTGSALALGLVGLAAFAPALLLALVAGAAADRFDRRLIITVCWALIAVGDVGLLLCALDPSLPIWPVFALTVLVGGARSFANPASQALLPNLVPREAFGGAVTFSASAWQSSSIIGPAIGGFLYAAGPTYVFGLSALFFAVASLLVSTVRVRGNAVVREPPTLESVFAGVRFIWSRKVILGAISLDLFGVLLGGAIALLPIYAKDILQVGPLGLGLLRSMPAAGAIAMTLVLAWYPLRRHAGRKMFVSVMIFGVATIVFGLSTDAIISAAALFTCGAVDMISVVIRQTLVQAETPDSMRGRVSAVNSIFIGASNELGEFESGAVAAIVGPVGSAVVGGVGCIVIAMLWIRLFPDLWNRDKLV